MIENDISRIAELDNPLAKIRWQLFVQPAYLRMLAKHLDTLTNSSNRTLRSLWALGNQKRAKAVYIRDGCSGPL